MKKAALKNFAISTGKHLRWSLFLMKVAGFPEPCQTSKIELLAINGFYLKAPS